MVGSPRTSPRKSPRPSQRALEAEEDAQPQKKKRKKQGKKQGGSEASSSALASVVEAAPSAAEASWSDDEQCAVAKEVVEKKKKELTCVLYDFKTFGSSQGTLLARLLKAPPSARSSAPCLRPASTSSSPSGSGAKAKSPRVFP